MYTVYQLKFKIIKKNTRLMEHQFDMANESERQTGHVSSYPATGGGEPILLPCHLGLLFCFA